MPVKKPKIHHRIHHQRHKRTKHYMKVYAPYLPLMFIVGLGVFLSFYQEQKQSSKGILSYATNMSVQGLLQSTNTERQIAGIEPLSLDPKLARAAQLKAQDMASRNYWSHNTPDGKQPWFFIEKAGYKYFKAAENMAYGFESSDSAVAGWMNSPGHRDNILDKDLREVGFGIINISDYQKHGPQTLVVAMYGLPIASKSTPIVAAQPKTPTPGQAVLPQDEQKISYLQTLTGGKAPWSSFVAGLAIGAIIMYLSIKHARGLRRAFVYSESFIIKHPLLDSTLIALLGLAIILSRTAGTIY